MCTSSTKRIPFAKNLKQAPDGNSFTHLGKDGVLRSLSSETQEVIDAVGLTPEQLQQFIDVLPPFARPEIDFTGVDGRKATTDELFHPAPGILPEELTAEEAAERSEQFMAKREAYLRQKKDDDERSQA